jgi:folate-binding protein YgfZ
LESTARVIETPLAEMHRADGARLGTWFGCALPDDFGDWLAEYRFARETVGVVDQNYRVYFDFTGPDRVRYLNAILTNNIKGLADHHGSVSLLLNPQGRILAEIETYAFPEKVLAISYALIREPLIEVIEKYIIMDDVTLKDETEQRGTLALEGPKAALCASELTGLDVQNLSDLELRECAVVTIPCSIIKRTIAGVANVEFLVERRNLQQLWNALLAAVKERGGGATGYSALNAVRLEQGLPWFGYDFGDKQIPHEAGLQDSHISYTKGCYTGQEIVERVRSRGQINRTRVLLKFDTAQLPVANTPLLSDAKEFGYVTSAAFSPVANGFIGMGYVRKERSAEGSPLEVTGGTATVYAKPLIAAGA